MGYGGKKGEMTKMGYRLYPDTSASGQQSISVRGSPTMSCLHGVFFPWRKYQKGALMASIGCFGNYLVAFDLKPPGATYGMLSCQEDFFWVRHGPLTEVGDIRP